MKFIKNTQAGKMTSIYILKKEGDILKKQYNLKIKKGRPQINGSS
jgi:hypothetical protein